MAAHSIRAIYTHGLLRPLEPLPFEEGEEVAVVVLSERERLEAALGDLLVEMPEAPEDEEDIDEEALLRHLHEVTRGLPPTSELIIEERRNGP